METETSTARSASYEGFVKVMNHLLFGHLESPSFNKNHDYPLNSDLVKFIPKNANAQKMNLDWEFYTNTFEGFITDFLIDCTTKDENEGNRPYSNHPAAKNLDAMVNDKIYHNDLIRYEKNDDGQSLSILYVNAEENCVEYLSYHTLHFLEIVKFIRYGQKTINYLEYQKILDHYNTKILKQRVEFINKKL
ncbi:hypothetical protein AB4Y90_05860 [Chryseobacterium sp. 2TAF14]|uniref:hypothetical protein n=1 Tax=Chryseobacterium sp. 2TAF14 TaxID=3233007 RepID=UPI003F8EA470